MEAENLLHTFQHYTGKSPLELREVITTYMDMHVEILEPKLAGYLIDNGLTYGQFREKVAHLDFHCGIAVLFILCLAFNMHASLIAPGSTKSTKLIPGPPYNMYLFVLKGD